jgi:hypothetical protein
MEYYLSQEVKKGKHTDFKGSIFFSSITAFFDAAPPDPKAFASQTPLFVIPARFSEVYKSLTC